MSFLDHPVLDITAFIVTGPQQLVVSLTIGPQQLVVSLTIKSVTLIQCCFTIRLTSIFIQVTHNKCHQNLTDRKSWCKNIIPTYWHEWQTKIKSSIQTDIGKIGYKCGNGINFSCPSRIVVFVSFKAQLLYLSLSPLFSNKVVYLLRVAWVLLLCIWLELVVSLLVQSFLNLSPVRYV